MIFWLWFFGACAAWHLAVKPIFRQIGRWIDEKFFEPRRMAMDEFYDLRNWIKEKMDDPAMSDEKWRELLPMCRLADYRFKKYWRDTIDFQSTCQGFIIGILRDEEHEKEEGQPV